MSGPSCDETSSNTLRGVRDSLGRLPIKSTWRAGLVVVITGIHSTYFAENAQIFDMSK